MVSKMIKNKRSTWEGQQEWEECLRRISTSRAEEAEACCAAESLYGDSEKINKNKLKKLKLKRKGRHMSRTAEELLCSDDHFEGNLREKKAKKAKKHKEKHQKLRKNKGKLEIPDLHLHSLPVKQRKDKKMSSLGGDQTKFSLFDRTMETLTTEDMRFSGSASDGYGSFRSHNPVCEGSYLLKAEAVQTQSHIHPKSKKGAAYRKNVLLDSLPSSHELIRCQGKPQKEGLVHMETQGTSLPGTCGKVLKSILVSKKARVTFVEEDKTFDTLKGNVNNDSQLTAENNSQELFITQKTFLPAESSSEESTGVTASFTGPSDGQCLQLSQELFLSKSTTEKATQTNDFFSSPALSTFFSFQKVHQKPECAEQALDLSMPRRDPIGSTDWHDRSEHEETSSDSLHPKLTNSVSNEQNRVPPKSKSGTAQLKGVQTRLNESFFFKMKGGSESPKPQSPLLDHSMTKSKRLQMKFSKVTHPSELS